MDDKDGTPIDKPPNKQNKLPKELSEFTCKKCNKPLIWRKGTDKKGKAYSFFGCSGFPKCKNSYDEVNGVPKYE